MAKLVVIPFAYTAHIREYKKQKPTEFMILDELPVQIREFEKFEFPIAVLYSSAVDHGRYNGEDDLKVDEIRFDGHRLFGPVTYSTTTSRTHTSSGVLDATGARDRVTPFTEAQQLNRYRVVPVLLAQAPGEMRANDKEERKAILRGITKDLVICDGKLWQACAEPCYRYQRHNRGHYLRVEMVDPDSDINNPRDMIRGDRLEDFIEVSFPDDIRRPDILGQLDVLMPEALRLQVEAAALIHEAHSLCESMAGDLSSASVEEFGVYAEVRDSVERVGKEVTDELVDSINRVLDTPRWAERASWRNLDKTLEMWRRSVGDHGDVRYEAGLPPRL